MNNTESDQKCLLVVTRDAENIRMNVNEFANSAELSAIIEHLQHYLDNLGRPKYLN